MTMDEQRASRIMALLGERLGEELLLWRGDEPSGSDVDLVVLPGGERRLLATLREAGLKPRDGGLWSSADGAVAVDPLPARDWPRSYPSLPGVLTRAARRPGLPLIAAPEDRLLIYSAEAVSGRSLDKLTSKVRRLLAEDPQLLQRLTALAEATGEAALAQLIADSDSLLAQSRRGRLPYLPAARVAVRSRSARVALATRAREAVIARIRGRRAAPGRSRGLLIALSGMDGAGKSSASKAISAQLERAGLRSSVAWHRLGEDAESLNRIALPLKRLLRRSVTIADPIASRSPDETVKRQDPRVSAGRLGPLAWTWITVVTAVTVNAARRTHQLRRGGHVVICDRWACDSIVDLQVRYGRHRAAEWLLRHAVPRPDLAIVLQIDAETAARRKPEDQALSVLRRMESLYAHAAEQLGALRIDATRPHEAILAELIERVEKLLATRTRLPVPA